MDYHIARENIIYVPSDMRDYLLPVWNHMRANKLEKSIQGDVQNTVCHIKQENGMGATRHTCQYHNIFLIWTEMRHNGNEKSREKTEDTEWRGNYVQKKIFDAAA